MELKSIIRKVQFNDNVSNNSFDSHEMLPRRDIYIGKTPSYITLIVTCAAILIMCILSELINLQRDIYIYRDYCADLILDRMYESLYTFVLYVICVSLALILIMIIPGNHFLKVLHIAYIVTIPVFIIFSVADLSIDSKWISVGGILLFPMSSILTLTLLPFTYSLYINNTPDKTGPGILKWLVIYISYIIMPGLLGVMFWKETALTLIYFISVSAITLKLTINGRMSIKKLLLSGAIIIITLICLIVSYFSFSYISSRVMAAITRGASDPYGYGYMYYEMNKAIDTIRLFGKGIADLPQDIISKQLNHFPLIAISLRYGWIAAIIIILAIIGVVVFLLMLSKMTPEMNQSIPCFGAAIYYMTKLILSIVATFVIQINVQPPFFGAKWQVITDLILFVTCVSLVYKKKKKKRTKEQPKFPLDKLHLIKYNRAKDKQGGDKDGIL